MQIKRKRPRDPVQRAVLVGKIATGELSDTVDDGKDAAAVALGRRGGVAGGKAKAARMTPQERSRAASKMAKARWSKK